MWDAALAGDRAVRRARSWPATITALVVAAAAISVAVVVVADLATLQQAGARAAEQSTTVRTEAANRFGPIAAVVLGLGIAAFLAVWAVRSAYHWERVDTRGRLRSRFAGSYTGDSAAAAGLHRSLATGDPALWTPLPVTGRGQNVNLKIWTVDQDRVAFAAVVEGTHRDPRPLELLQFSDRAYDGVAAVLRSGPTRPLPDAENPMRREI